jgi:hypothetical protein
MSELEILTRIDRVLALLPNSRRGAFDAQDYLRAAERLLAMYETLDQDDELVELLIELLLQSYEELNEQMQLMIAEKDYEAICAAARDFKSSVRSAVSESSLDVISALESAASSSDYMAVNSSWLALHRRLYPLMFLFRRYHRSLAESRFVDCDGSS